MAVTAPVSLSKIKTEFSGPDTFSSYVRSGSYVPSYPVNSGISTTVAGLAISQFLGASDTPPVSLPEDWGPGLGYDIYISANYYSTTGEGQTITSRIELNMLSDGTMTAKDYYGEMGCLFIVYLNSTLSHTWLQSGSASDYYVRLEQTSGTTPGGAFVDTNLQLNLSRSWELCVGAAFGASESSEFYGILSIRDAANTVLASKTIAMVAQATNQD